jgi:hypothetical protein
MNKYLEETNLVDYNNIIIQNLVENKNWKTLDEKNKIKEIYLFVRDEILFGYNQKDNLKASQILEEGYGQCNTKSTLLMALLRAVNIPCRFHGFTINKALQKGAITGIWYKLAPKEIIHSWVEVKFGDSWNNLEGVILDKKYLNKLQNKFSESFDTFCGYGVYTDNFYNPKIDWKGENTYIQKLGINQDFGIFDNPDEFYNKHQQELNLFKQIIFKVIVRNLMNKNIMRIRND